MPDKLLGERICAYIETKGGATLTFDNIIEFLKSKNASVLQLPERIIFVESMPMTKVGKLDKNALRKDIEKKIKDEA
jgi:non-ribosomal peptide synthetase component E (peptide arylation enzyme)